jgi:hypothetical protein
LYAAYIYPFYEPDSGTYRLPLRDEMTFAAARLEDWGNIPSGTIDRMIRALFACHDLGKLNRDWQAWAHQWQKMVGIYLGDADRSVAENCMLAHTDSDGSDEQKQSQRKLGRKPNHAAESAIAAARILEQTCGECPEMWQAGITAIARHHHAMTNSYKGYTLHTAAPRAVREAFEKVGLGRKLAEVVEWRDSGGSSLENDFMIDYGLQGLLYYMLLVRVLRLADQRSQAAKLIL